MYFYPRSPCGERHHRYRFQKQIFAISIHALLAESDGRCQIPSHRHPHFYPRSPCGERQGQKPITLLCMSFLSTLSLRRATLTAYLGDMELSISIHALLAESDYPALFDDLQVPISIHALLAESDAILDFIPQSHIIFLSTLSLRRATPLLSRVVPTPIFLSTLSLRRATLPTPWNG